MVAMYSVANRIECGSCASSLQSHFELFPHVLSAWEFPQSRGIADLYFWHTRLPQPNDDGKSLCCNVANTCLRLTVQMILVCLDPRSLEQTLRVKTYTRDFYILTYICGPFTHVVLCLLLVTLCLLLVGSWCKLAPLWE